MEFKQHIITKFLMTEGSGAEKILAKLRAQFKGNDSAMRNAQSCRGGVE
jgi:hypothetical protein